MNVKQHLSNVFFSIFVGALLFGAKDIKNIESVHLKNVLFMIFLFFLRLKIYLDDTEFLGSDHIKRKDFQIGYVTSIISWIFFCVAGYSVWNTSLLWATTFLILSIIFGTIWTILAAYFTKPNDKEAQKWIWINIIYLIFLVFLYLATDCTTNLSNFEWIEYLFLIVLILTTMFDYIKSKSFSKLNKG